MSKNPLTVTFGQMQYLVAELHLPDLGVTQSLDPARAQTHIVPRPQAGELRTVHGQFADECGQTLVMCELSCHVAHRGDRQSGLVLPIHVEGPGAIIQEQESQLVGTIIHTRRCITVQMTSQQQMTGSVPGEHIIEAPQEHCRHLAHSMQELLYTGPGNLESRLTHLPLGHGMRQRIQMSSFVHTQLQGTGKSINDRIGRILRLPLLQTREIRNRYPSQLRQLLSAQSGYSSTAIAADTRRLRGDAITAGPQKLPQLSDWAIGIQRVRGDHAPTIAAITPRRLSLPVLGSHRAGISRPWLPALRGSNVGGMNDTDTAPGTDSPLPPAPTTEDPVQVPVVAEHFSGMQKVAMTVLLTANFTLAVDFSILNVALPHVGREVGFTTDSLQWIVTVFALCAAGFTLFFGRVADLFGRKRFFLLGILLLGTSSLLGGLATTPATLLAARVGQGIATAMVTPAAMSLMTTMFPEGPARSRAFGLNGALMAAGFTAGAVLGGVLTGAISWRWAFFINVVVALAVILIAPVVLKETRDKQRPRLDVPGAITITLGLVALVLGIDTAGHAGWAHPRAWGPIVLAAVLITVFLLIETRVAQPLIAPALLKRSNIAWGNAAGILAFATETSLVFLLTLYLQEVLGYNAVTAGLILGVLGIGTVLGGLLAPRVIRRSNPKSAIVIGLLAQAAATFPLVFLSASRSWLLPLLIVTFIGGIANLVAIVGYVVTSTSGVPDDQQGLATGMVTMSQQVGIALGTPVMSAIATAWAGTTLLSGLTKAIAVNAALALMTALLIATVLRLPTTSEESADEEA